MIVTPRNQPALPLELRPERPARVSQTLLANYSRCKHSAYLYMRYRGAVSSPRMEGGSLVHEVLSVLTNDAIENGWETIPHEIAKAALFEQFASGKFTVLPEDWDHVRRCVYNFAAATEQTPANDHAWGGPLEVDKILGVEQLVVMQVGDWRVSGKLDLALRDGATVIIRDYKSSPHPLTQEEFNQSLQQKVYSLLAAYGEPVTIGVCLACEEGESENCVICMGRGYVEIPEPYALGEGAQHFDIAEVYPALAFEDGGIMQRRRVMSRRELLDERSMLEALLEQVTHSFDSGEWPAIPSDDACGKCPARRDCPLPPQLLPFDSIDSPEEAQHYAMAMELLKLERDDITKALKAWVKNGKSKKNPDALPRPIDLGNGTQLTFVPVEVNQTDYDGYSEAISAGRVVDLDEFRSKRIQTSFKPEPIPVQEATADEKYGADAPWGGSDLETAPSGPQGAETALSGTQDEAA